MSKEFMRRYTLDREPKAITAKDLEQPYESTFDFQMKMAFETMVESFAKKSDKEIIDFLYKKYMNTDVKDLFLLSETDFKQYLLETLPKWKGKNTDIIDNYMAFKNDNAEPSESLKCLERIDNTLCLNNIKGKLEFGIDTEEHTDCDSVIGMTEDLESIKQALLKAQEQEKELERYKVLEKELKSEINVLFLYMEFTKLFFEIFNLNYSNETFTLSLIPNEEYNIENVDLKICLIKEDADKILKVAELLEKEVEE